MKKLNEKLLRIIYGSLLAFLIALIIFLNIPALLITTILIITFIGSWEYLKALQTKEIQLNATIIYAQVIINSVLFFLNPISMIITILTIEIFCYLILLIVYRIISHKFSFKIFFYLIHIAWIVLPMLLLMDLINWERNTELMYFLILLVIFNDTFAYFGGITYGKHLLAPSISPKKTIEGSLIGLICASIIAGSFAYFRQLFPNIQLIVLSLFLSCTGQIGDLIESKFKRFCTIKDSSNLIPGHGGVLDRIDAFLIAIPTFYFLMIFLPKIL